jgi:catechol 2,3-dioxygenase-like lactoylglutathione lyase family enzyme
MRILETIHYAEDLEAAHKFYANTLGLEVISFDPDRDLFMQLEDSVLIVFKASKTIFNDAGVPPHGMTGIGHVAFRAEPGEVDTRHKKAATQGSQVAAIPEAPELDCLISFYC